jgi:sirohydrochlorin cobaltochelatase
LGEALDRSAVAGAEKVAVITPMMTRGGGHATVDIPQAVSQAQERHSHVQYIYVWPFEVSDVAQFLAEQIDRVVG